ncbi:MAG: aminotransferase class V-fold PLP-dependent enzyme [Proteobacteria bacterium]|nr:aminotransferase class V-fold PLP-dependent enzyme [Pseudomonadota bacterium]
MHGNKPLLSYRDEFPITKRFICLDHAGIAPVPLRAKKAVEKYLKEASRFGAFYYQTWKNRIEEVRKDCAHLINSNPKEIAFVKNTSHGLSLIAGGLNWKRGDKVLLYEKEFPGKRGKRGNCFYRGEF